MYNIPGEFCGVQPLVVLWSHTIEFADLKERMIWR